MLINPEVFIGKKYNDLTVIAFEGYVKNSPHFICKCKCGNTKSYDLSYLKSLSFQTCGCLQKELGRQNLQKALVEGTSIYNLNRGLQKNNKTGIKGVSFNKERQKYEAQITFKGKKTRLGYFSDLQEAAEVRRKAENELFTPFLKQHKK